MKYSSIFIPGLFLLAACSGGNGPQANENSSTPVNVTIATPSGNSPEGISASGQVEAEQTAAISTRIMGAITRIYVKPGDKVAKGQTLVTISSQDLFARKAQADAMIAAAEADLANAHKDYDRFTHLYNRQSATASEMDNATLRYKASKSKLDAAQQLRNEVDASINYTRLVAPFSGTVTQKAADEGSMAIPGMLLLSIEQSGQLQVSAAVSESDISRIKLNDKATIAIKATGSNIAGSVAQISPSSVATGGQYVVKISIPASAQKDLYAGMYVNVVIGQGAAPVNEAVLIPVSALVQNDQFTGLYTMSSAHTALLRWVRTGRLYGDRIEVLSGLGRDEPFILNAEGKLYNGVPVRQ